jgi:enoyl-CoA hydratase
MPQDMVLTGKTINAAEAERTGLVSRVVPVEKTLATALEVAHSIAGTTAPEPPLNAPSRDNSTPFVRDTAGYSKPVVEMAKDCVNRAYESSLAEGLNYERHLFHAAFATVRRSFAFSSLSLSLLPTASA